jgi:hypothetical protein
MANIVIMSATAFTVPIAFTSAVFGYTVMVCYISLIPHPANPVHPAYPANPANPAHPTTYSINILPMS